MPTKYGVDNVIVMLSAAAILILVGVYVSSVWASTVLIAAGAALALFTLWFFRDPKRKIPPEALQNKALLLAPADGKIIEISKERENNYLKTDCVKISVFLSAFDVHINRSPAAGLVEYFNYYEGEYHIATSPKSSLKNEQTHIGLKTEKGKIFFKQIVGVLARRLVWDIKIGDRLEAGQKFGMMKFGSRIDLFVPQSAKVRTQLGDKTRAGETIIAEL